MAEVMDEKNATVKRLELLEEGVDLGEKGLTVVVSVMMVSIIW